MATPPPARTAPRRRLPPLAALALALMAAGLASAKTFTPPPDLTAAPRTPRLSTMRTSATGIANTWTAQPVKSAYDAYLKSMRKPPITLVSGSPRPAAGQPPAAQDQGPCSRRDRGAEQPRRSPRLRSGAASARQRAL